MIIKQQIKEFEKLGLGMFVHFGLYSLAGKGEAVYDASLISDERLRELMERFDPRPDWAQNLVAVAKDAGCKYITLTTRHQEGFSLFDTCGLNTLDAMHAKCGRDLVKEFVDACREQDMIPFFYHTLLDCYQETFDTDFPRYLRYVRNSVELLCTRYGKIGGLWLDGTWSRVGADWEEDALYACIRKHQPDAMIINNTGMLERGALGNIELDCVTFERGRPEPMNREGAPKYVAAEMCEIFGSHWGYARDDLNFKSFAQIIRELAQCRRFGANMLLNVGPMGDGSLRLIDRALLELLGQWMGYFAEAVRTPRPTDIVVENKPEDFLLWDDDRYYLFCLDIPMIADPDLVGDRDDTDVFELKERVVSITWMDDGASVPFVQENNRVIVTTEPFAYGRSLVVRVARILCAK